MASKKDLPSDAPKDFVKDKLSEAAWFDVQCNLSAMVYLITEQQALIGKLLEELVRVGAIKAPGLERITDIKADHQDFNLTYKDVHRRFSNYFYAVHKIMSENEPNENGDYDVPEPK